MRKLAFRFVYPSMAQVVISVGVAGAETTFTVVIHQAENGCL
jgi:hypothetical protein